jgi:hypothetical protein
MLGAQCNSSTHGSVRLQLMHVCNVSCGCNIRALAQLLRLSRFSEVASRVTACLCCRDKRLRHLTLVAM